MRRRGAALALFAAAVVGHVSALRDALPSPAAPFCAERCPAPALDVEEDSDDADDVAAELLPKVSLLQTGVQLSRDAVAPAQAHPSAAAPAFVRAAASLQSHRTSSGDESPAAVAARGVVTAGAAGASSEAGAAKVASPRSPALHMYSSARHADSPLPASEPDGPSARGSLLTVAVASLGHASVTQRVLVVTILCVTACFCMLFAAQIAGVLASGRKYRRPPPWQPVPMLPRTFGSSPSAYAPAGSSRRIPSAGARERGTREGDGKGALLLRVELGEDSAPGDVASDPICSALILPHGKAQFSIPVDSIRKLRAATYPVEIFGPGNKAMLHVRLPVAPSMSQGSTGSVATCRWLELTTTAKSRYPHASIGPLPLDGRDVHELQIHGPRGERYGDLVPDALPGQWHVLRQGRVVLNLTAAARPGGGQGSASSSGDFVISFGNQMLKPPAMSSMSSVGSADVEARREYAMLPSLLSEGGELLGIVALVGPDGQSLQVKVSPGVDALLTLLCTLAIFIISPDRPQLSVL